MAVGSVFTVFAAYGVVRFMYRKKEFLKSKDPPGVSGKSLIYYEMFVLEIVRDILTIAYYFIFYYLNNADESIYHV